MSALTQSTIQNVGFLGVPCSPYSSLVISFVTDNKNSFNNQSFLRLVIIFFVLLILRNDLVIKEKLDADHC